MSVMAFGTSYHMILVAAIFANQCLYQPDRINEQNSAVAQVSSVQSGYRLK